MPHDTVDEYQHVRHMQPLSSSRHARARYRAAYTHHQQALLRLVLALLIVCVVGSMGAGYVGWSIGGLRGVGIWLSLSTTIIIMSGWSAHRYVLRRGLIDAQPQPLPWTHLLRLWCVAHVLVVFPLVCAWWLHERFPRGSSLVLLGIWGLFWYRQHRKPHHKTLMRRNGK